MNIPGISCFYHNSAPNRMVATYLLESLNKEGLATPNDVEHEPESLKQEP